MQGNEWSHSYMIQQESRTGKQMSNHPSNVYEEIRTIIISGLIYLIAVIQWSLSSLVMSSRLTTHCKNAYHFMILTLSDQDLLRKIISDRSIRFDEGMVYSLEFLINNTYTS